jgi:predicted nucleic acid-binding protein
VRLFLDTSVVLAACGSTKGASHALFDYAESQGWELLGSQYVFSEVLKNLPKLPESATTEWTKLRSNIQTVADILTVDRATVFLVSKDRPILFTAFAWADVLITLDKADFIGVLGETFYGLPVFLPYDFLAYERRAGRLKLP